MTEEKVRDWVQNTLWANVLALIILLCSVYGFGFFWRDITHEFNPNSSQIISLINSFCIGCAGSFIFLLATQFTKGGLGIVKGSESIPECIFNVIICIANLLFIFILVIYFKGSWVNSVLKFFDCQYQFNIETSLVNTCLNKVFLIIGGIAGLITNEYYHLFFDSTGFWTKRLFKYLLK